MRLNPFVLAVVATAVLGCHKADPFVGTWKSSYSNSGMTVDDSIINSNDGTFTTHARASNGSGAATLIIEDRGTWKKISEGSYEVRITDTNWTPEGGTAARNARMIQRFTQNKTKILAEANKLPTKTIKWKGTDEFTETSGAESVTYHRAP